SIDRSKNEIEVKDLSSGETRQLTHFNEKLLGQIDLGQVEEIWFKGADDNDLQGWIIKPPGFDPGRRYPAILEIHGGPWLQYGNSFMHEFYYLAARGYVVFFCNPRGGQGYGEQHSRAIANDWGSVDYADLMAWTDHVAGQPYVDPKRVGVAGGSYGGYMTSWIIGHTDRFQAAVAQRVVSNLVSMWGSSDFNWTFQQAFGDKPPWENLENLWRQSPMAHIGNARTPTLVIHSEQDMRCELEQGLQLYIALKTLGVPTELILFPDEPHGLSRGGRTDRRVVRLEHIGRWFDRYLKP
ncbi:MAG: alpha/beta hydrolase family protein, partial [Candidatus Promineifilaceae bacterium]